jgi:hypothetical protein
LAAGDADEDALVEPVEIRGGGLDLRRGAEVYSLASTSSPRAKRATTSALPWRTPRDWT